MIDIQKFKEVVESIELSDEVILRVSLASDQRLAEIASELVLAQASGEGNPTANLGAIITVVMEASERGWRRETGNYNPEAQ